MNYLRYRPDIEQPAPQEQVTIDGFTHGTTQQSETVERRERHAVRASHAKSSALVTGTLEIAAGLPPELAQGLFATPGSHPVAVRFAQDPGETLGDRVSTHRGMAIKVYEIAGEKRTMTPTRRILSSPAVRHSRRARPKASCATAPSSANPPGCPKR